MLKVERTVRMENASLRCVLCEICEICVRQKEIVQIVENGKL